MVEKIFPQTAGGQRAGWWRGESESSQNEPVRASEASSQIRWQDKEGNGHKEREGGGHRW
jgi:hypothetical protein